MHVVRLYPPTNNMDFSAGELIHGARELPELLRKFKLLPSGHATDVQLQVIKVEEIGDGNLNYVYRAHLSIGGDSMTVIVKYAPTYIRCLGPSYPLTQGRLEVEYAAMCEFYQFHTGSVPCPVLYDAERSAVIMEDLNGYSILRAELMEGNVEQSAICNVMGAIGAIHKQTLQKNLSEEKWKDMAEKFGNKDMVAITAEYVFTNPFQQANTLNKHDALLDKAVQELRNDTTALDRAAQLKRLFLESKECLCHGDLHTGSVMVKGQSAKMIDEEFAFVGPAGFDVGAFLANLVFALIRHHCLGNGRAKDLLWTALSAAVDAYCSQCSAEIVDHEEFAATVCGFMGIELIRRTIGTAHVEDLSSLPEGELIAMQLGHSLLVLNYSTSRGRDGLVGVLSETMKNKQL